MTSLSKKLIDDTDHPVDAQQFDLGKPAAGGKRFPSRRRWWAGRCGDGNGLVEIRHGQGLDDVVGWCGKILFASGCNIEGVVCSTSALDDVTGRYPPKMPEAIGACAVAGDGPDFDVMGIKQGPVVAIGVGVVAGRDGAPVQGGEVRRGLIRLHPSVLAIRTDASTVMRQTAHRASARRIFNRESAPERRALCPDRRPAPPRSAH